MGRALVFSQATRIWGLTPHDSGHLRALRYYLTAHDSRTKQQPIRKKMKQFVITCIVAICTAIPAYAQKYLDHLKQNTPGNGTVTISQSKEIDELVNGKLKDQQDAKPKASTNTKPTTSSTPTGHNKVAEGKKTDETKVAPLHKNEPQHKTEPQHKEEAQKRQAPDSVKKAEHHEADTKDNVETETPTVDMRKKVMRGSYKVTGYRVQAYAGGNSRVDRQKAEQIGNAIKMRYPNQPVYVHFYSPRWICRVGNFRSLSEAQAMLGKIRAMGYRQACLVKGKITVQN